MYWTAQEVIRRAEEYLGAGLAVIHAPGVEIRIAEPIPVLDPDRAPNGWFIPLLGGDALIGFMRLDDELTFLSCAQFPRPIEPSVWIDQAAITERVRQFAGPGCDLSEPFLSYDAVPARLAWRVDRTGRDGSRSIIFIAGDAVYEGGQSGLG
jgi:hypothetical protein